MGECAFNAMDSLLEILLTAQYSKELPRQGLIQFGYKRGEADSVAAHSFSVVLTAYLIAREMQKSMKVDIGRVLELAVLHDCGEFVLGDIGFFSKLVAKEIFDEIEKKAFGSLFANLDCAEELSSLRDEYCKLNTLEAQIVKAADALDAIALAVLTPSATYPKCDLISFKKMRDIAYSKLKQKNDFVAEFLLEASNRLFSNEIRPYMRHEG